jgi:hypothetical protein
VPAADELEFSVAGQHGKRLTVVMAGVESDRATAEQRMQAYAETPSGKMFQSLHVVSRPIGGRVWVTDTGLRAHDA